MTPRRLMISLLLVTAVSACSGDAAPSLVPPHEASLASARVAGPADVDRLHLHDCRMFRQFYLTSADAAEAVLPEGYSPVLEEDGTVVVLTDITQCEGFTFGQRRGAGGAIHHEVLRVQTPEGEVLSGGFGFPATFTNPHLRKAFREIGIPGGPAQRLEVRYDPDRGGSTVVDNLPPFGPDYTREFQVAFPADPLEGGPFVQHHQFENGSIRRMAWSFPEPQPLVGGPATPLEFTGEFTLPVIGEFPVIGDATAAFATPDPADWVVFSLD